VSQQINLFNPVFLKQKKYFSALTMVQALALILLGCGLLVLYANFQLSIRTRSAAATAAQLLTTRGQLITVTAQFAPHQNNQALDDDIKNTQIDIQAVQHVFDALRSGDFGDTKGYSGYFRAFSRQIIDGLWLTGISIVGAGHDINLRGRTLNPELVPAYLTRLKREPEMQGKSFSELDMQVQKANAPAGDAKSESRPAKAYIDFNLQSSESSGANTPGGVKNK
jgi:Tfp pilus assembly protein PilN